MPVLFKSDDVLFTKENVLKSWIDKGIFNKVENQDQDSISVRWVVSVKVKIDVVLKKARLVARSFKEDTTYILKDSPNCFREANISYFPWFLPISGKM